MLVRTLFLGALSLLAACAQPAAVANNPCDHIRIPHLPSRPVAEELPKQWVPFLGIWSGAWPDEGNWCQKFALTSVSSEDTALFAFRIDEHPAGAIRRHTRYRVPMRLVSPSSIVTEPTPMIVKGPRGAIHTHVFHRYTVVGENVMRAIAIWGTGYKQYATFRCVKRAKASPDGTMTRDRYQPIGGRVGGPAAPE